MKELCNVVDMFDSTDIEAYSKSFPNKLEDLLQYLLKHGDTIQNEPYHRFIDGAYARELFIPKDQIIVGGKHKTEHFVVLSKGDLSIADQGGTERIKAPCTFVSPIGTQRVIYAHEDSILTTIHVTNERDVPTLERTLIEGRK